MLPVLLPTAFPSLILDFTSAHKTHTLIHVQCVKFLTLLGSWSLGEDHGARFLSQTL
jgi:hypothetical protein